MMTALEILRCDLVYRFGWVLLHSLWQITLLAFVLLLLLAALRGRSANLRYVIGCAGLAMMFVLPVATYCVVPALPGREGAAVSMPSGDPPAVSVTLVPPPAEPLETTLPSARPPESAPHTPGGRWGSPPLPGRPSPEPVTSAHAAVPLPEWVSQAISPWIPWFVVAWVAGVFSLSVWHLGGWIATQRLKHLATTPASLSGAQRLAELIERMRLSRPVRMLQSAMVDVPAVIGWLRPVLLVPAAMLGELSPQQIDAVLAHELAHIRRYDYLVNLFQVVVETLLFYHPGVWWLSRRIRIERENCCDDAAVALCGNRVDYAAALMAMEQGRLVPRLAVAAKRADRAGTALSRVRRVLGLPSRDLHGWRASLGGGFGVLLLIGTLAGYVATGAAHDQGPGEKTAIPVPAAQTGASLLDDFRTAETSWTQAEVGRKLIALGDKSILPEVAQMLKSEDRRTRCNAGWVLAGLGDERGLVAVLVELLDTGPRPTQMIRSDGKPNVPGQIGQDRYYAVHVLGEIGDRRAVPELIEALKDESINYKAAIVLGGLGDRRAIPALKQMLKDCQPDQRLWAGSGLAKLGDPLGVPTVAEFLKHPQWTQRRHAADALGELQDKRAGGPLIDVLKDKQAEVRVSAARALGRLADQSAIPALEALLDDHEVTTSGPPTAVRDAAAGAIRQIRGAGQPTAQPPARPKPPAEEEQTIEMVDPNGGAQPKPPAEEEQTNWGPAVQGVQCRLEADKPAWKPAEMLTLKACVRHQTESMLFLANHPMFGAQLQVDGHWHRSNAQVAWAGPSHSSSKFRTKDQQPLTITLDENWIQVDNKEPLRVDPGRHVIRFAWEGHPESGPREGPDEQRSIVLVSNPLEITVPAERPQPKPSDVHADDRHAAAALQALDAILAADAQGKIHSVRLSRTAVTDTDLIHLKGLSGLKALYLDDTRVTDAALQHLAGLTGLETLSLNYTRISDAGLEHLKGLKGLRSLALLGTEVTAAALRELKKTRPDLRTTVDPLKLSGLGDLRGWRNSAELSDAYELLSVDLLDANITDASLERLKDRQSLQDVCLSKAKITDTGLAHLQGLTDLHTLYLSNTQISDAGLEYLKAMKKLKTLFLAETRIGDSGLARLSGLTNLESLLIDGTQVTDAGMVHLKPLTKLTLLRLNDCQFSGAGLSHLRDLTKLTALELNRTAVSDTGLVHLQPFVNLELLYLSHTSVTDAGLDYLSGLKKLRMLEIQDTAVTDDGIQRLKLSLPNTSVYR